jgi:hypothetical protein
MNDPRLHEFQEHLTKAIASIAAGPRRKRMMSEELLSHLLTSYQEELLHKAEGPSALDRAIRRFGNVEELRLQLQASVPFFERILFMCLDRKETIMLRWIWILGVLAWTIGAFFNFTQIEFLGVAVTCGSTFWHLCQRDNIASRLVGPRWPWLVGFVAVLFGTAVVLPAMAKIKQQGGLVPLSLEALSLGELIVLGGVGFFAQAIKKSHVPPG